MKIGAQIQKDKEELASREEIEGMKIGANIGRGK
jgi:hypothetical protein